MQGHFCFIKCLIFEQLPEVDVSAICWIFDEACSCGPYIWKYNLVKVDVSEDFVYKVCASFRPRIEAMIAADGEHFEIEKVDQ